MLKLPLLLEHYLQHKAENKLITLANFLEMHYATTTVYDDDYAQDMQLPFKAHTEDLCFSIVSVVPNPRYSVEPQLTSFIKLTIPLINSSLKTYLSSPDIFQPPKLG